MKLFKEFMRKKKRRFYRFTTNSQNVRSNNYTDFMKFIFY